MYTDLWLSALSKNVFTSMRSVLPLERLSLTHKSGMRKISFSTDPLNLTNRKIDRPRVGPSLVNGNLFNDPSIMVDVFVEAFVAEPSLNPFLHQVCHSNLSFVMVSPKAVEFFVLEQAKCG